MAPYELPLPTRVVIALSNGLVRFGLDREFLRDGVAYGWKANLTSTLTYLNHRVDLLVLGALGGGSLSNSGAPLRLLSPENAVVSALPATPKPKPGRSLARRRVRGRRRCR